MALGKNFKVKQRIYFRSLPPVNMMRVRRRMKRRSKKDEKKKVEKEKDSTIEEVKNKNDEENVQKVHKTEEERKEVSIMRWRMRIKMQGD